MGEMLLDCEGDVPVADGYKLITSEIEFLDYATHEALPLHVRGAGLCTWAEVFFQARRIPFRFAESPLRELTSICTTLSNEQARVIYDKLASVYDRLSRPMSTATLLTALYPARLWSESPSRQHAAEWLTWLYEHVVDEAAKPLVDVVRADWLSQVNASERLVYEASDPESACSVLDGWLGIADEPSLESLGEFPIPVPSSIQTRARAAWRRRLIETSGDYFATLARRSLPSTMKQLAAKEAVDYYGTHPGTLQESALLILLPYLSISEQNKLRQWLRPSPPSGMPSSAEEILDWFQHQYLPFRFWQSLYGGATASTEVHAAAESFARWYLEQYPAALNGSPMQKHLSFMRSAALARSDRTAATLLVVLDGLHVADARHLSLEIQNRTNRLTTLVEGLAFAPLPTITQYCKPALFHGVPPDQVGQVAAIGEILPERVSPLERLKSARPGTLYLWRVLEPDNTYHKRNNYDTLRNAVKGQLDTIASNVVDIVEQAPDDVRLRIVVTTDHGRLLADSHRIQPAPEGMEVHGRTAWGTCNKDLSSGFLIDGNVAYLHPKRFGLPHDTAVLLDESAFTTQDGRGGSEHFSHGGLFPEEVIIPWIVYERDVAMPNVDAIVSGRSEANRQAEFDLRVTNLGDISMTLSSLELDSDANKRTVHLDWQIGQRVSQTRTCMLERWPTSAEIKGMRATLHVTLANGLTFEIHPKLELQSDEMYQRDDILEGLDL